MKIDGNAVRPGYVLEHLGRLWVVTKIQHTQPGKGGAYMQVEMKDIRLGTKLNERFRSSEKVERVRLDEQSYQFLYREGTALVVMDPASYEQHAIDESLIDGDAVAFLTDGMLLTAVAHEGSIVGVTLPETVVAVVDETEPVVKGQTAASSYKPALLTNGVRIMVPPFIQQGERVIVRTSDATYMERAKD